MEKLALIDYVGKKAGMDYYDIGLLKALSKKGVEVFLYSNFYSADSRINFFAVFGTFYRFKLIQFFNFLYGMIYSCFSCKKNGINYVVVHLFSTQIMSFLAFLICRLFGLKIIAISHDVSSFAKDDNSFFKYLIYHKWSYKVVVHNQFSYDSLHGSMPGIKEKTAIIKHGSFVHMPDKLIDKKNARAKLNLDQDQPFILFFGQIKKVKKLDVLLRSMAFVNQNIKLIVAGKVWKDDFKFYQKIIDQNQLNQRVLLDICFISDKKRELYFKAADLIVLPYQKIYQSGVLLMAMSYNLVPIVSNIEPFKEVINDGVNGFLFNVNDSKDLANVINKATSNQSKLELVSQSALESMKTNYSWDKIADDYLEFL
jgi:glycosyltransferase involved in cell wall biosynthesis